MLLLLLSGDVEENPGPTTKAETEALLQKILAGQTAIRDDIKDTKESFDRKIDSLAQKFQKLEEELQSLKIHAEDVKRLEGTIRDMTKTLSVQQKRLIDLEDRSRRNNLVVFGISEPANESQEALRENIIKSVFSEKLGVTVRSIERIHRLGARREGKTRPVIVRLFDFSEKIAILTNCKQIKGTRISINSDYSQATLEKRRLLWSSAQQHKNSGDQRHEALKFPPGLK